MEKLETGEETRIRNRKGKWEEKHGKDEKVNRRKGKITKSDDAN